jgi:selenocysteine lyase/cysteine desulfurase
VLVDYRPRAGVRFSPHFYNTMEEIDRAIGTVDEILSQMPAGLAAR